MQLLYTDAMSIKLVLLKSNEEVIADVKELVDENDKPIFIVLENPYCCKLIEDPVMLLKVKKILKQNIVFNIILLCLYLMRKKYLLILVGLLR